MLLLFFFPGAVATLGEDVRIVQVVVLRTGPEYGEAGAHATSAANDAKEEEEDDYVIACSHR